MSQATWSRSHWALVVVVIILIGLVAVKHTAARRAAPEYAAEPSNIANSAPVAVSRQPQSEQHATAVPTGKPAAATQGKSGEPLPGSEFENSLKSGRPTVADFGAGWCAPCKKMVPVLAEAVMKYDKKVNIVFVNTDEYPAIAKLHRISAIPTQVFFDAKGNDVGRHVGYYPIEDLDAQLKALGLSK